MLEVLANGLQRFRHVRFYRESGDMQLLRDCLMAQPLYFCKMEYLLLLWRELNHHLLKKLVVLPFNQRVISIVYMLVAMCKFSFRRCLFRDMLDTV